MHDFLPQTRTAIELSTLDLSRLPQFVEGLKQMGDEELAKLDIAALNLMCAGGLPGAEGLDFGRYFDWLDDAAREADLTSRRHWYRFNASPQTYNQSPGYFCCYFLLQVLQEMFGVRYNPARVRDGRFHEPNRCDPDFGDSRDLFIHGIIDGPGGTCASMPVVYVAVGRRLGYPLKLVESRGHLFVRWEDPLGRCFHLPERFNVEGAGEGIASYPDDFYRTWPEPWTDADVAGGWYLKSLTPKEELAAFLVTRACCLEDNGRLAEAVQAYCWARDLAPHDGRYVQIAFHRAGKLQWQREMNVAMFLEGNRRAREASKRAGQLHNQRSQNAEMPPHIDGCSCKECARAKMSAAPIPSGFDHGPSCQCFHCQQRRKPQEDAHAISPFAQNAADSRYTNCPNGQTSVLWPFTIPR
ncbi:MAG: hypothetical protein ACREHD_12265 [Pirellulales bacterium]